MFSRHLAIKHNSKNLSHERDSLALQCNRCLSRVMTFLAERGNETVYKPMAVNYKLYNTETSLALLSIKGMFMIFRAENQF